MNLFLKGPLWLINSIFVTGGAARPGSDGKLDGSAAACLRHMRVRRSPLRDDERCCRLFLAEYQLICLRIVIDEEHIAQTDLLGREQICEWIHNVAFNGALQMARTIFHVSA